MKRSSQAALPAQPDWSTGSHAPVSGGTSPGQVTGWHSLETHDSVRAQAVLQVPQWSGSRLVSTQRSPQASRPISEQAGGSRGSASISASGSPVSASGSSVSPVSVGSVSVSEVSEASRSPKSASGWSVSGPTSTGAETASRS